MWLEKEAAYVNLEKFFNGHDPRRGFLRASYNRRCFYASPFDHGAGGVK
jgi:hypothetical protein